MTFRMKPVSRAISTVMVGEGRPSTSLSAANLAFGPNLRHPPPSLSHWALYGSRRPMQGGWVYIMTNRPNGTLYIGVTSDLPRRAWQHREGLIEGFTKQ